MIDSNEVRQRLELGLDWIVSNQNPNNSFGSLYPILNTALVALELGQYAINLGLSPLDSSYKYYNNLVGALNYLFSKAEYSINGIYYEEDQNINYTTGAVLAAISASQSPNEIITTGQSFIQGLTYKILAQYMANYLSNSQDGSGGWAYNQNTYDDLPNNFVSGYVGLGMLISTSPLYGFDISIPEEVTSNFTNWVDYIQNVNGGSGYSNPDENIDILKTGNLLVEMNFLNFLQDDSRVVSAVSYIANTWYDPACYMCQGWNSNPVANYQSMYALMSGLRGYGYTQINQTVEPFNQIDYMSDIANVLIAQQNTNGSYNSNPYDFSQSDQMLSTIWALLTLQLLPDINNNIVIDLASDQSIVVENDIVTYTLTVSNQGDINAFNSIIRDTTPEALSFIEGSVIIDGIAQPVGVSPIVGIELSTISVGQVRVISYQYRVLPTTQATINNIASITFDYALPYSSKYQTQTNYSNEVSIKYAIPNLIITASVNKNTAVVGEILTYTINATNDGGITLYNGIVANSLDPNLEYINNLKVNGIPTEGNIITGVNIGTLDIGQTTVINFDVKVISIPANGKIGGVITVQYDIENIQPVSLLSTENTNTVSINDTTSVNTSVLNNEANEVKVMASIGGEIAVEVEITIIVKNPEISISKSCGTTSIQVGETATYYIEIVNNGELDSLSTIFKDVFPPQLVVQEIKSNGEIISGDLSKGISLGPLVSGKAFRMSILIKAVEAIDDFENVSITTMEFIPVVGGEISTLILNTPSSNTLTVKGPQLSILQSATPSTVMLCDVIKFDIKIKNTGEMPLYNVILSNILSQDLQYILSSLYINGKKAKRENILRGVSLGIILPNQELTVQFDAKLVNDSSNPIYNYSQAYYSYVVGDEVLQGYSKSNTVQINIFVPGMQIKKTANIKQASTFDSITYTITIINTSNLIAYDVIFRDVLANSLEFIYHTFTIDNIPYNVNECNLNRGFNIGSVLPQQVVEIKFRVRVICNDYNFDYNIIVYNIAQINYMNILENGRKIWLTEKSACSVCIKG